MNYTKSQSIRAISIFIAFTLIFSTIFWILRLHAGEGRIGVRLYGFGSMWCPALATLLTCTVLNYKIRDLAWGWGKSKFQALAYLLPLGYALVAYLIIWLGGWGGFYNKAFVSEAAKSLGWENLSPGIFIILFFLLNGVLGMFNSMALALGEEIGWRGFLVPHLNNVCGYTRTSLISGFIWAFWHYPVLIWGNYNNGTPAWYGLICFTVLVVSMSFIYSWFRLKSGSLWTGVILHASHNLFIQTFFTPITEISNSRTNYYIDEFGAVLPVVVMFVAVYFWTRRKEVL